jgi:hypothetical protein
VGTTAEIKLIETVISILTILTLLVLKAVEAEGFHSYKWKVMSALGMTTVGLLLALKRLEGLD